MLLVSTIYNVGFSLEKVIVQPALSGGQDLEILKFVLETYF